MMKRTRLEYYSHATLAVWPDYRAVEECWFLKELVSSPTLALQWGKFLPDKFENRASAIAAAQGVNRTLGPAFIAREMDRAAKCATREVDHMAKRSLELKIDKVLQSKQRFQDEEAAMLAEAMRRHATDERPDANSLRLAPESEEYRDDLAEQLSVMPYLRVAKVGRRWVDRRWTQVLLFKSSDGIWSMPYTAAETGARLAERAKVLNGFGFGVRMHWGKAKTEIRQILLSARQ